MRCGFWHTSITKVSFGLYHSNTALDIVKSLGVFFDMPINSDITILLLWGEDVAIKILSTQTREGFPSTPAKLKWVLRSASCMKRMISSVNRDLSLDRLWVPPAMSEELLQPPVIPSLPITQILPPATSNAAKRAISIICIDLYCNQYTWCGKRDRGCRVRSLLWKACTSLQIARRCTLL